jgi:hypothetical protein
MEEMFRGELTNLALHRMQLKLGALSGVEVLSPNDHLVPERANIAVPDSMRNRRFQRTLMNSPEFHPHAPVA